MALDWYDSGHEDRDEFQAMIENLLAATVQEPMIRSTKSMLQPDAFLQNGMLNPKYTTPPAQPAKQEPVAKVRVNMTGSNAGLTWSATAVNAYDSLPPLADGTLLYTAAPAAHIAAAKEQA
jgi:hypothetical protein